MSIICVELLTTMMMGKIAAYSTIHTDKRTYNSFTQWELPVMLGYNFGKNKFNLLAEGGLRLLLKRTWEGEVLGLNENVVDLSAQDWYHDKLSVSLQAGLSLGYNIHPKLQLSTGLQLRYSLSDFTNDNALIKENYHLFGGQLALKWRL